LAGGGKIKLRFAPFLAGFLLGLIFDPEFGSHKFLLIIGGHLPNYMVLQPEDHIILEDKNL
jgi:hypothetical protein